MIPRSYLFVPGDRPERFAKALDSGAHVVILDLEDAVTPERKRTARDAVADFLVRNPQCFVRINGVESVWFKDDLAMLRAAPSAGVMLPKAETAKAVDALASGVRRLVPVIALIESAAGLARCRELARMGAVVRLAFGSVDFALDLGIKGYGQELLFARSELVLASRLADRPGPLDGVTLALDSEPTLVTEIEGARRMGFGGKLCVHPKQVAPTNTGFQPDAAEIAWAQRVLAAAVNASGALRIDGKLVDRPIIEQARQLLAGLGAEESTAQASLSKGAQQG